MSKPANRLGKGLSAIISPRTAVGIRPEPPGSSPPPSGPDSIRRIPIDAVRPNPNQPRSDFSEAELAELAASIKNNGVLQPVLVRPIDDRQFELVAGERRLRACRAAGLATIPAIVREMSDRESLEIALIENLQREDLGPLERAVAYDRYMAAFGATPDQLAAKLSESRANIANYLRLLKLHPDIQALLKNRSLGMGQARAIAGIADPQRQLAVARLAVSRNLSVRQVEQIAASSSLPTGGQVDGDSADRVAADKHLRDLERRITRALGLKVNLKSGRRKNSGRLVVHYANLDEFDRLAERLGIDLQFD